MRSVTMAGRGPAAGLEPFSAEAAVRYRLTAPTQKMVCARGCAYLSPSAVGVLVGQHQAVLARATGSAQHALSAVRPPCGPLTRARDASAGGATVGSALHCW